MMVPMIDPVGGQNHPAMASHPYSLRSNVDPSTPDQILAYGPPRGRGEVGPSGHPLQSVPLGPHQFHGPPPPGWLDSQSRGAGGRGGVGGPQGGGGPGQHSASVTSANGLSHTGGPLRRSPRGGPVFRFDFPPPHHHLHPPPSHARQLSGGSSNGGPFIAAGQHHRNLSASRNAASGGGGLGVGPPPLQQQQQRSQVMRVRALAGGPGGPVCVPRRRPEHLHLVGPLGEPMFVGSPTAAMSVGSVGGAGAEANAGPETVSRVLIPNCKIGAVIGKGGAIIKHIREVSGAKVTISDSCTGLHDDADDRMVTAAGTFNSVQLAFTHILSHAGAVGPDADPVMGLAGGDPDCVANAFRLLIPNVKAGGLIGRGGCTIKAIREHSGARIEISSQAFHFHPVHGPLPAPSMSPTAHGVSSGGGPGGVGPGAGAPRMDGAGANGFSSGGPGAGGPSASHGGLHGADRDRVFDKSNIVLPPPILMDRVMTAMGSFDACLRAHHLVASKLMEVRPSPVPMPPGPPLTSAQAAAAAAASVNHARSAMTSGHLGHGPVHAPGFGPGHGQPRVFNFESVRGIGGGGAVGGPGGSHLRFHSAAGAPVGTTPTASTSPASSISELSSSCHRQPWNFDDRFDDRSWAVMPSSPPLCAMHRGMSCVSTSGSGSDRLSASSSPGLASSSNRDSPPVTSVEPVNGVVSSAAAGASAAISQLSLGATAISAAHDNYAPDGVLGVSKSLSGMRSERGVLGSNVYADDQEAPPCLADIIHLFGGSSGGVGTPRSPSTVTGIDVEVGRAAFALLGVHDLDDIKHLSGAGIIAPESPESYCDLPGEVMAAAAAVLSAPRHEFGNGAAAAAADRAAARGTAPADGLGLAAAESKAAAEAAASSSSFSPPHSSSALVFNNALGSRIELAVAEGFSKEADGSTGTASPSLMISHDGTGHRGNSISNRALGNKENMGGLGFTEEYGERLSGAVSGLRGSPPTGPRDASGVGARGGNAGMAEPNPLKTVRITGTAEEIQLAEYLIRVRTAGRYMVAA